MKAVSLVFANGRHHEATVHHRRAQRRGENEDETTLATKNYVNYVGKAQAAGYRVTLLFFWLNSPDLAIRRVAVRVREGGHDIPEMVIRRRYNSGLKNFFNLYKPLVDNWILVDNSFKNFRTIAEAYKTDEAHFDRKILTDLKNKYDGK